jgi:glycosyltransferase involved in cell wall biosynthesis
MGWGLMAKKKILYIIHRSWPYLGGAERHFFEWAKSSRDTGYEVTLFTTDVWDIEYFHDRTKRRIEILEEEVDGIKIKRFRVVSFPSRIYWGILRGLSNIPLRFCYYSFGYPHIFIPGYLWKMLIMREKFDIVHVGVFPHLFLIYSALKYCRRFGIPAVCTPLIHSGEPHYTESSPHMIGQKQIELLEMGDKITSNTSLEKALLQREGIPGEKIHVIGPGVDPGETWGGRGERFREKYGIKGKMVLQISTQTHDKGSPHLIEAMKIIWQRGIEATLVLIGQIMEDFDAYFLKQPPEVYEKTLVLDYIDEQTKKDALDACDVFVMASKADSFGIVYLEAWLYKKPVIGAYAGGVPEVIADGKDGFLVPFADIHMLSEYIHLLLEYPVLANAMGHNGYLKVLKQHTWDRSCEKIQNLYKELLGR